MIGNVNGNELELSSISIGTIHPVNGMRVFIGIRSPLSLDHNKPSKSFQYSSIGSKKDENPDIRSFPFLFGIQDVEPFEYVYDTKDDHRVSDPDMVHVPVDSVFVIRLWSQQQGKHLQTNSIVQ